MPAERDRRSRPDGRWQEYEAIARRYLDLGEEAQLYEASLLGRELLRQELGPAEIVHLHSRTTDAILSGSDATAHRRIVERLAAVLLEVLMVYGQSHQRVRDVLAELQARYEELDRTKSELETSRDELREKTAQLVQTGKMNALGELSAGVAHEINQPLNAMKIICQDLLMDIRRGRLDVERLEENLLEVIQEMGRVAEIVHHMRVFTRKTAGTRREAVLVDELVRAVLSLIGQQLALQGIEVTLDLAAGRRVVGDRVRLQQVFMNLITNARDACARNGSTRGKRIRIRTCSTPADAPDPSFVVFEIHDNGGGIPENLRERIFEPFFTTKEAGEGTGLGLSVTKQIVEEHGGAVELLSPETQGTTFRVLLPAERDDARS